jgi:tRNA (cytidine/uridine-2'-O-)-methyltransferase
MHVWADWKEFQKSWTGKRIIATSAQKGEHFSKYSPLESDGLLFGPESTGLPEWLLESASELYTIPLREGVRSLNLATTVGFFMGFCIPRI